MMCSSNAETTTQLDNAKVVSARWACPCWVAARADQRARLQRRREPCTESCTHHLTG